MNDDHTPNIPEIIEEVRDLFERYEQALIDKDVAVLDGTFWNSPPRSGWLITNTATGLIVSKSPDARGKIA